MNKILNKQKTINFHKLNIGGGFIEQTYVLLQAAPNFRKDDEVKLSSKNMKQNSY